MKKLKEKQKENVYVKAKNLFFYYLNFILFNSLYF